MEGWTPGENIEAVSDGEEKNIGMKRSSPDAESPEPKSKRQKRAPKAKPAPKSKPKKAAKKEESDPESDPDESSELSELSELSDSEEKPQKKQKQAAPKKTAPKKAAPKRKSKKAVSEDEDEDVAMESDAGTPAEKDDEAKIGETGAQNSDDGKEKSPAEGEDKPIVDEEEEYSDVIDEPPKPKRKKKDKKEGTSKPAKAPKATARKSSTSDDPNTEEIKRLQGHLVKCGVRKLWHNELKQYGDDAKAKIRHLKKMLSDVGMDGRFSEAKAREIKERRELLAEVESAQEMSSLWGVEGRGRASRSKSKNVKIVESDGSDVENNNNNDDDDDDEGDDSYAARRRRARADLAFLGDDDESD